MAKEPENLVLERLRGTRAEMAPLRDLPAQMAELRADFRSEMHFLRAGVASDFSTLNAKIDSENKATRDQIVGLRPAVIEYHSAVIGHGMLISELEARVRPMEQHLNLPSMDAHRGAATIRPAQDPCSQGAWRIHGNCSTIRPRRRRLASQSGASVAFGRLEAARTIRTRLRLGNLAHLSGAHARFVA